MNRRRPPGCIVNMNCQPRCPPCCPPCCPPPTNMQLFIKALKIGLIFGAGFYAGCYMAQNYQMDKVEDPKVLFARLQDFVQSKLNSDKPTKPSDGKNDGKCDGKK